MSKLFSNVMLSSVVLGSLASAMLVETAAAKPMSQCQVKHSYCSERCIMNNDGDKMYACIQRTCDRQHPGCGGESIDGDTTAPIRPRGKRG